MNKEIQVGYCDLKKHVIKDISIPKNSVIFTSYALHYVQKLPDSFIDFILSFEPKIVINFEPCFESHDDSSYGKLCKRYIELNYLINIMNQSSSHKQKTHKCGA